jgi:hypothetical protein
MITLGGTSKSARIMRSNKAHDHARRNAKACESCDQTRRMITLGGTFKARESCDQTRRMITLGADGAPASTDPPTLGRPPLWCIPLARI